VHFAGKEHECFVVLFLDSQHRLIVVEELFRGTIDGAAVYPREVVKAALRHNAAALVLSHNHPSGVAEPSAADRALTERLRSALAVVDVRTLDHVVVGGTAAVSFAERGWM
jgi:DNA repair protein RadC